MNNITETWKKYRNKMADKVNSDIQSFEGQQEIVDQEPKRMQRVEKIPSLYSKLQGKRTAETIRRGYESMGKPVDPVNSVKGVLGFYKNANIRRSFGLSASNYQKAKELPNLVRMGIVDANAPKTTNPQLGKKVLQRIQKISRVLQRYTPTKFESGDSGLQGN